MEENLNLDVDNQTADLMLSGDMLDNIQDKHFTIVGYRQISMKDLSNPNQMKKKLILLIRLADGTQVEMYANRTSQNRIAAKKGLRLQNWVGYQGELVVLTQMIGDKEKKVLYVKG